MIGFYHCLNNKSQMNFYSFLWHSVCVVQSHIWRSYKQLQIVLFLLLLIFIQFIQSLVCKCLPISYAIRDSTKFLFFLSFCFFLFHCNFRMTCVPYAPLECVILSLFFSFWGFFAYIEMQISDLNAKRKEMIQVHIGFVVYR